MGFCIRDTYIPVVGTYKYTYIKYACLGIGIGRRKHERRSCTTGVRFLRQKSLSVLRIARRLKWQCLSIPLHTRRSLVHTCSLYVWRLLPVAGAHLARSW